MMTLEEIRRIKRICGYTNARLSELSGIPLGTLNKILSGDSKKPRKENIEALENVFRDIILYDEIKRDEPLVREDPSPIYGEKSAAESHQKKPGEFTIEDYYALPDDQRVELIDGVFYDMASPTVEHQLLAGSIYAQFLAFIRANRGSCIPIVSPVDVKLDADNKTMVQPDVVVLCDKSKITKRCIVGGPDFVLEVVSPSSVSKDYIKKAAKYEAAGVREYWIVDPLNNRVLTYEFGEEFIPKVYPLAGKIGVAIFDNKLQIDFDEYKDMMVQVDDNEQE